MLGVLGFQEQANSNDAEKLLTKLIYDENEHVLSSLQLNQLASLTYHERSMTGGRLIHERLLDILEKVLSQPVHTTVLAMHKALVILRHLLLYGAEQVLAPARTLDKYVQLIAQSYNTALMAQQATGATGFFLRLKGGAVDQGGPVRDVAHKVHALLSDPRLLQFERSTHADPSSLVPVGSHQRVAFITDEARLAILKQRMERERQQQVKSNLAKSESAFGSGFNSKDGSAVVGAAHSLEEMMKEAQRKEQEAKRRFTDEPNPDQQQQDRFSFSDYQAPTSIYDITPLHQQQQPIPTTDDLLSFDATTTTSTTTNDLLALAQSSSTNYYSYNTPSAPPNGGGGSAASVEDDLLGFQSSTPATTNGTTTSYGSSSQTSDFLGSDDFGPVPPTTTTNPVVTNSSSTENASSGGNPGTTTGRKSVMTSLQVVDDRFAALDALTPAIGAPSGAGGSSSNNNNHGFQQQQQQQLQPYQRQMPSGSSSGGNSRMPFLMGTTTSLDSLSVNLSSLSLKNPTTTTTATTASTSTPVIPAAMPTTTSLSATSFSRPMVITGPTTTMATTTATSSTTTAVMPASSLVNPRYHGGGNSGNENDDDDDDDGGGFLMGGIPGSGLEPLGPAPAAPPPPPPPP